MSLARKDFTFEAENFAMMFSNAVEKRVITLIFHGAVRFAAHAKATNDGFDEHKFFEHIVNRALTQGFMADSEILILEALIKEYMQHRF